VAAYVTARDYLFGSGLYNARVAATRWSKEGRALNRSRIWAEANGRLLTGVGDLLLRLCRDKLQIGLDATSSSKYVIGNPGDWRWIARMGERERAPQRGSFILGRTPSHNL